MKSDGKQIVPQFEEQFEMALNKVFMNLVTKLQEIETIQDESTKAVLETVERFSGETELEQKIVEALIKKVMVYEPEHVEIKWNFLDKLMKAVMGK